jgi:L-ascorbate metabolism protein UlaG (beta-lactamase superfamily)
MAIGWRWVFGGVLATMLATWAGQAPAQSGAVKMEWLSWSIFRFTSPGGKIIVTNPFVTNPDSPVKVPDFPKVDVILVADGHPDEVGSTHEIAIQTGAKIVTPHEMWFNYFQPRNVPEAQMFRSQPGDWLKLDGLTIRNVGAVQVGDG